MDVLAALPLELFYLVVATNVERNVVLACRLNRLLRVGRLSGFVDAVLRQEREKETEETDPFL